MNKILEKLFRVAEDHGWSVNKECDDTYDFGKTSPAGQDFHISINTENNPTSFLRNFKDIIFDFDVSEEAYLWLDHTGHGKNGAPKDMMDVYEDMQACFTSMEILYNILNEVYGKETVKDVKKLRIKRLDDLIPLNDDAFPSASGNYTWYYVKNDEDFDLLNQAYRNRIDRPTKFPEIICVETAGENECSSNIYNYKMMDIKYATKKFWRKLGYYVSFEKK